VRRIDKRGMQIPDERRRMISVCVTSDPIRNP
jgi:hypothetical protein